MSGVVFFFPNFYYNYLYIVVLLELLHSQTCDKENTITIIKLGFGAHV